MSNKNLGPKIRELRNEGLTYKQIKETLGCSLGTISYHLGDGQKEKHQERQSKNRSNLEGAVLHRIYRFTTEQPVSARSREYTSDKTASRQISDKMGSFARPSLDVPVNTKDRKFSVQDVLDKFGKSTVCYLTGTPINLAEPKTYEFDHIVPRKLNGSTELDNLGITTKKANRAKGALTVEEFVALCRSVVEYYDSKN